MASLIDFNSTTTLQCLISNYFIRIYWGTWGCETGHMSGKWECHSSSFIHYSFSGVGLHGMAYLVTMRAWRVPKKYFMLKAWGCFMSESADARDQESWELKFLRTSSLACLNVHSSLNKPIQVFFMIILTVLSTRWMLQVAHELAGFWSRQRSPKRKSWYKLIGFYAAFVPRHHIHCILYCNIVFLIGLDFFNIMYCYFVELTWRIQFSLLLLKNRTSREISSVILQLERIFHFLNSVSDNFNRFLIKWVIFYMQICLECASAYVVKNWQNRQKGVKSPGKKLKKRSNEAVFCTS